MTKLKDQMVQIIGQNAAGRIAELAGQFVCAKQEDKEAILAGIDFERWMAECCRECLNRTEKC